MTGIEAGAFGAIGLLVAALVVAVFVLYVVPVPLWIAAWSSGAYVSLFTLVGMRLRRVPPSTVVTARISAVSPATFCSASERFAGQVGIV